MAPSTAPANTVPVDTSITGVGIARALKQKIPAVRKTIRITVDNDSDNLLGKPDGYSSAAVVLDKRVDCGVKGIGASCGALIEVWPTAAAATTRLAALQSADTKASVTERDYERNNVIVRVTGSLSAAQALAYRSVLDAQVAAG